MAEVKVLIAGEHTKINDTILIGSTSTLIKTDKKILVDTGSFSGTEKIVKGLSDEGISPLDIDIVVLTHIHLDHVVNTSLFRNAQVYCKFRGGDYPGQIHTVKEGYLRRFEMKDGIQIAEGVGLLLTPGHTDDMISVLVETAEGKVAIVGDTISSEEWADLEKEPEPMLVDDIESYNASRRKILAIADYIIPGHGSMFKVKK